MKILVLSDSHSGLRFMRHCIAAAKPDAIIHLGDHYDDGAAMAEENPHIITYQVPGNCDCYRCPMNIGEILDCTIDGVQFFITHGHKHHVKCGTGALLADARRSNARIVLYGHTHRAECYQEADGIWVLNPGSCGSSDGTAGVIEVKDRQILDCRLIRLADLEELT